MQQVSPKGISSKNLLHVVVNIKGSIFTKQHSPSYYAPSEPQSLF